MAFFGPMNICASCRKRNRLVRSYLRFIQLPFPEPVRSRSPSLDDRLGDFHLNLVGYDANFHGAVLRVVEGAEVPPELLPQLDYDATLEDELAALVEENPELVEPLRLHRRYLMRIKKLVRLAHSVNAASRDGSCGHEEVRA